MLAQVSTVGSPMLWGGFLLFVVAMLALDLGVFNRRAHAPSLKEAWAWTAFWIALAVGFNVWIHVHFGDAEVTKAFTVGYVVEKALSVDNLFVFLVIFRSLAVPPQYQHRVLFWGVLGALVTRGIFIYAGVELVARFDWIMYVFGGFLVFTGLKLMVAREVEPHPERNAIARLFIRWFPMTSDYREGHFFVREAGRLMATPLLLAVVAAEATDIVFAVDSIPAIFGITTDPFIIFTSNVFAILGLRSLFFVLAGIMDRFHLLKYGLAMVLVFIGAKMVTEPWFHVSIDASLLVILVLVGGSIAASLLRPVRT